MLEFGGGLIINIVLMLGIIVNCGFDQVYYNCFKVGVIYLLKSLVMEWVGKGICVNFISLGYIVMLMNICLEMVYQICEFESQMLMQWMVKVEEMVGLVLFFVSDVVLFCIGVDLVVDGGFVCW